MLHPFQNEIGRAKQRKARSTYFIGSTHIFNFLSLFLHLYEIILSIPPVQSNRHSYPFENFTSLSSPRKERSSSVNFYTERIYNMAGHALPFYYFTISFPFLFLSFLSFIHKENKTHTIQLHLTHTTTTYLSTLFQFKQFKTFHYQFQPI